VSVRTFLTAALTFMASLLMLVVGAGLISGVGGIQVVVGSLVVVLVLAIPSAAATAASLLWLRSPNRRLAAVGCGLVGGAVGFAVVRVYMAGLDMGPAGDPGGDIQSSVTLMLTTLLALAGATAGAVFRSVDDALFGRR
jgi:hypothetical protein